MPRAIAWTLWTTATIAAAIAIVAVASQPTSNAETEAAPEPPSQPAKAPENSPAKDREAKAFIQEAHRSALDEVVSQMEQQLAPMAPWDLLRAGKSVPASTQPFTFGNFTHIARWKEWRSALSEIHEKQLDHQRKVLKRTAIFWLDRALHRSPDEDPLYALRTLRSLLTDLYGLWTRADDATSWQPAVTALAQTLTKLPPPSKLDPAQRQAEKQLQAQLQRELKRLQSKKLQSLLAASWATPIQELNQALRAYQQKRRSKGVKKPDSDFTQKSWQAWTSWELAHTPSIAQAQQGIASTRNRLARIESAIKPAKTPRRKPTLKGCIQAREALHTQLAASKDWIETQVSCERLLALYKPATHDALMHHLIVQGWVEPTRLEVRQSQRPLMAALASQWGAPVHAQMRELMLLSILPSEPWVSTRLKGVVNEMQSDLCHAQRQLAHLDADERRSPKRCPKSTQPPLPDRYSQLKGVRTGAMATTRAVMAGLDRFYWGPTQVALYWATPKGVELGSFGQDPRSARKPVPKPSLTPITP